MTGPPPSAGTPPGWFADPSGRHRLRWWDGTVFSDQVTDGGPVMTDDGRGPVAPPTSDFVVLSGGGRPRWVVPVGVAGLVVLVGAVAFLVLGADDDGSGFGEFTGEVDGDVGGAHRLSIPAGSVVTIELRPDDDDFDPGLAVVVDDDTLDALDDAFDGSALEAEFESERRADAADVFDGLDLDEIGVDGDDTTALIFFADLGFEGEDEELVLLAPIAVEATLVVGGGFAETDGAYELTIERFAAEGGEDPDDFIDGIVDDDDLPRAVRSLVEDLLERIDF